jgi:hypothetical protein
MKFEFVIAEDLAVSEVKEFVGNLIKTVKK